MSIEKYTTEAFILKSYENGEDDFIYKVWTKDFGIIFVLAKSIRKINAKLRVRLKSNNFLILTLVKGKNIWRLTGVEEIIKRDHLEDKFTLEAKAALAEAGHRFLEEKKGYKRLFEKMEGLILESHTSKRRLTIRNLKMLIYYLILVDTGYADAEIIGVKNLEEYKQLSIRELYTFFSLNSVAVREHLVKILKESML